MNESICMTNVDNDILEFCIKLQPKRIYFLIHLNDLVEPLVAKRIYNITVLVSKDCYALLVGKDCYI